MTERVKALLLSGMLLLLTAVLAALVFLFPVARPVASERLEEDRPAYIAVADGEPASPAGEEQAEAFVLRDLGGYIAVYRLPEADGPDTVTGIATRTLRRADYLDLQTGIQVVGWENLQKALEDFGPGTSKSEKILLLSSLLRVML